MNIGNRSQSPSREFAERGLATIVARQNGAGTMRRSPGRERLLPVRSSRTPVDRGPRIDNTESSFHAMKFQHGQFATRALFLAGTFILLALPTARGVHAAEPLWSVGVAG